MYLFFKKYYAITDRKQFKTSFEDQIKRMLDKGIRMFQLREKDLPDDELFFLAEKMKNLLDGYDAVLLINSRVDIAILSGANGVHLPEKSVPIYVIKHKFPDLFVGKSCHTVESAKKAEKDGADFITFSPVYHSPGKGNPVGIDKLKEVVKSVNIPVYALGGITEEKIPEVLSTGAYGIAGIRLFID